MRFKTILLAMGTLTALSACDQPTSPMAADAVEQRNGATSAIDPSTGEPVALNYRPAGKVVTVPWKGMVPGGPARSYYCDPYIYDPYCQCDPYDPYGCQCDDYYNPEGCDPITPPPCDPYMITGYTEHRAGTLPYNSLEVSGITSSNCGLLVLTGIGARINEVTTIPRSSCGEGASIPTAHGAKPWTTTLVRLPTTRSRHGGRCPTVPRTSMGS